jgi:hypothetical protein
VRGRFLRQERHVDAQILFQKGSGYMPRDGKGVCGASGRTIPAQGRNCIRGPRPCVERGAAKAVPLSPVIARSDYSLPLRLIALALGPVVALTADRLPAIRALLDGRWVGDARLL